MRLGEEWRKNGSRHVEKIQTNTAIGRKHHENIGLLFQWFSKENLFVSSSFIPFSLIQLTK